MIELPISSQSSLEKLFLRWDNADTCQYYFTTGEQLQLLLTDFDSVMKELIDCNDDISSFKNVINSVYNLFTFFETQHCVLYRYTITL